MSGRDPFDYEEKRTFFGRFGFVIIVVVIAGIGIFLFRQMFSGADKSPPRKPPEMVMIRPLAPPPPPPPPPPPTTVPKQEMVEQTPLNDQDVKQDKPQEDPALGTNIRGSGAPDGFGLTSGGGGAGGGGGGGPAGSRFGWYAREVSVALGQALRSNPQTRGARFDVKVRIWSDSTGRITRVRLAQSTGDSAVDAAIRDGVLGGFQLPDPPPDGMPMPIVMHLSARRPY